MPTITTTTTEQCDCCCNQGDCIDPTPQEATGTVCCFSSGSTVTLTWDATDAIAAIKEACNEKGCTGAACAGLDAMATGTVTITGAADGASGTQWNDGAGNAITLYAPGGWGFSLSNGVPLFATWTGQGIIGTCCGVSGTVDVLMNCPSDCPLCDCCTPWAGAAPDGTIPLSGVSITITITDNTCCARLMSDGFTWKCCQQDATDCDGQCETINPMP